MSALKKRQLDASDNERSKKARLQNGYIPPAKHKRDHLSNDSTNSAEPTEPNIHRSQSSKSLSSQPSNPQPGKQDGQTSREAHAKQKQVALERKAHGKNFDEITKLKKIWERLRIKSAVPKADREKLVRSLFDIITGRVKEFVFKHDSVRVVQTALKYATPDQKKQIALELTGSYRELAESKYAKFLVAKLVMVGDEVRDAVIPEFYGHIRRLMRHPEASWIVDDVYRSLATQEQKARLLREWYGPEFVVEAKIDGASRARQKPKGDDLITADLSEILKQNPEKRAPIMQHLKETTNQLVQKKTTGFTMLHDALLQYFLNTKPGSPEAAEFLEMLKDDEEGDLFRNLAFTKSGSRLVCLALAHGNSKDRRTILKFYKTHMKLLSGDVNGHLVLLTAYEVIDDTVMTSKAIFPELLSKDMSEEGRMDDLFGQALHLTARIPLLYLMSPEPLKWLVSEEGTAILDEVKELRATTSKKDPNNRRAELVTAISQPLLDLIALRAASLAETSFGCQFITEVLLGAAGNKDSALQAVTMLATPQTSEGAQLVATAHAGRMFKTLVQGGRFDKTTGTLKLVEPPLKFHNLLHQQLQTTDTGLMSWASGPNSFAVVAMLEANDFDHKQELTTTLLTHREMLEHPMSDAKAAVSGAKLLLDKIEGLHAGKGDHSEGKPEKSKKSKLK